MNRLYQRKLRQKNILRNENKNKLIFDFFIKYIPIFIVSILVVSLLFNFGYFVLTSLQYLSFFTYSDYLEGSVPIIIFFVFILTFVFTQPLLWLPKIRDDFFLYSKEFADGKAFHKIIYKKIKFESFIGVQIQNIMSDSFIHFRYQHNPILQYEEELKSKKINAKKNISKNIKLKKILVRLRKFFRPIKKIISFLFSLLIFVCISFLFFAFVLVSILGFILLYLYCFRYVIDRSSSIFVLSVNLGTIFLFCYVFYNAINHDFSIKSNAGYIGFVILCFYAPILGQVKFLYDWQYSRVEVYIEETKEKAYLIRAIGKGYFVKIGNELLFIPSEKIMKSSFSVENNFNKENL